MKAALITLLLAFTFVSTYAIKLQFGLSNQFSFGTLDEKKKTGMPVLLETLFKITDDGEFEQVAAILERIRREFVQVRGATKSIYDGEETNYNGNRQRFEDTIRELQKKLEDANDKLEDYQKQKTDATKAIQEASDAIRDADSQRTNELKRRQSAQEAFEESQRNIDQAIVACGQVLDLLEEIKSKENGLVGLSLLQTEKQKIHTRLEHIQEKLAKIKTKDPVSPFLNSLVELADGQLNSEIAQQIIDLVTDIRASLRTEKKTGIDANAEDESQSKIKIAILDDEVATQKNKLKVNQENLPGIEDNILTYTDQVAAHTRSIQNTNGALDTLNQDWEKRSTELSAQISRLDYDVKSLEEAANYLNSQAVV